MAERLTDKVVKALACPAKGNRIKYDGGKDAVVGFGVRVTTTGARSFVLNYRIVGRERRLTIGGYPTWSVVGARHEAKRLRRDIDRGIDPLGEREALREAPTVNELCTRYLTEHAVKKRTGGDDEAKIRRIIRPELGSRKVASITFTDIDRLARKVTIESGPYQANRVLALLSKMFNLAVRWEIRADNPCRGVERNLEERRYRYLTGDELRRLTEALAKHPSQSVANVIRLLLLTGARLGEVIGAEWCQVDLAAGVWTKPSASTKTKREHRIPLSGPARQLLVEMRAAADGAGEASPYLFPARAGNSGHLTGLDRAWATLCKAAGLRGVRLHDLRHTYASILASAGLSLPIIGGLLGHTQPNTTARYSHLFDDPLRTATERAAAIIEGREKAEVVGLRGRG
jgi:integrase